MEISLKIKICKNKQFSITIDKLPKLNKLINSLISVLETGCHNVDIDNQEAFLKITTFEDVAMLSTLKTFVEVVYFNVNNPSKELEY